MTWGWPTYSSRRRGPQRLVEAGVVVGRAAGDEAGIGHGARLSARRACAGRAAGGPRSAPRPPSLERAVDAPLGLGARVAEVGEGGEEVVLGARAGGGRGLGASAARAWHLVLELEDQALRGLLPTPGMRVRRATSLPRSACDQVGRLDAGEDVDGELGTDARRRR